VKRVMPLIVAAGVFFIAAVMWIGNDRSVGQRAFDEFSMENTSDSGLSLAFHYLQRTGHRVSRLDSPLRPNLIPNNAIVIRAGNFVAPEFIEETAKEKHPHVVRTPLLTTSEDDWVRNGGRLVLATDSNFGPLELRGLKHTQRATKVFPIWPGVDSLFLPEARGIAMSTLPPHMHALFTAGAQPVIARDTIGRGDVIVIVVPEILQNQHLRAHNGLSLLTALAGAKQPIYFDESIHGFESTDGSIALMKEWGLGPFLFVVGVAALLMFWRNASRVGEPEDDFRDTRSDAVDLVRSLGALYKSATTDSEAIALYRDSFVRTVAAQTGLRGEALNRRVAELLKRPSGVVDKKSFQPNLDAINDAFRFVAGGHHANHR